MKNRSIIVLSMLLGIFICAIMYLLNENARLTELVGSYSDAGKKSSNEIIWCDYDLSELYDYVYEVDKDNDTEFEISTLYALYLYPDGKYVYNISNNLNGAFISGHIGNYKVDKNKLTLSHLFVINKDKTIKKDTSKNELTINEGHILTYKENNREINLMINGTNESIKQYKENGKYSFNTYFNYKIVD